MVLDDVINIHTPLPQSLSENRGVERKEEEALGPRKPGWRGGGVGRHQKILVRF